VTRQAVRPGTVKRRLVTRRFGARSQARLRFTPRRPQLRWPTRPPRLPPAGLPPAGAGSGSGSGS
jgi:hypothetical protein